MTDRFTGSMDPGRKIYSIVPSGNDLAPRPKSMWANQACTITVVGDDGNAEDIVVAVAGPVDFSPKKVTACTAPLGTLKGIWG